MPRFDCDGISIDPDEYINACGHAEITDLIETLYEKYESDFGDIINGAIEGMTVLEYDNGRNIKGSYIECLRILANSWHQLSQTDEDIIKLIAKKYGSL